MKSLSDQNTNVNKNNKNYNDNNNPIYNFHLQGKLTDFIKYFFSINYPRNGNFTLYKLCHIKMLNFIS